MFGVRLDIKSLLGFSYFVLYLDDCSRMTWIFLMKDCSEISFVFQLFHKEVMTQFGCVVRDLQSDIILEYIKGPL